MTSERNVCNPYSIHIITIIMIIIINTKQHLPFLQMQLMLQVFKSAYRVCVCAVY